MTQTTVKTNGSHGPGWRPTCKKCYKGMRWEECSNCSGFDDACPTCGGEDGRWVCTCGDWVGADGYGDSPPGYIHAALNPLAFAYAPDYDEIAAYIALSPASVLYDLFVALRRAGVDVFDLVPCVLDELAAE